MLDAVIGFCFQNTPDTPSSPSLSLTSATARFPPRLFVRVFYEWVVMTATQHYPLPHRGLYRYAAATHPLPTIRAARPSGERRPDIRMVFYRDELQAEVFTQDLFDARECVYEKQSACSVPRAIDGSCPPTRFVCVLACLFPYLCLSPSLWKLCVSVDLEGGCCVTVSRSRPHSLAA